jgi:hypothetical protein
MDTTDIYPRIGRNEEVADITHSNTTGTGSTAAQGTTSATGATATTAIIAGGVGAQAAVASLARDARSDSAYVMLSSESYGTTATGASGPAIDERRGVHVGTTTATAFCVIPVSNRSVRE